MRVRNCFAFVGAVALLSGLSAVPPLVGVAGAASQTISIAVDHATPAGHDFEYVDFFPRSGVTVHTGDVLDFHWSKTPDGLHTATLLKNGETPAQAWASNSLAVSDSDDGGLQLNPAVLAPTHPPVASGAPGACGDATKPCVYDGSGDLNSGANPTDGSSHFFVKVNVVAGTTLDFVCLIHPGMHATVNVVAAATATSTPTQVSSAATAQAAADTGDALSVEAKTYSLVQNNADGTHTVTLVAGTATPYVEIAEMLPRDATIIAGDTVRWVTYTIKDIHTVTFPQGDIRATEPIPNMCEGNPDVLMSGPPPPGPPCGNPTKFEVHLNPGPVGPMAISTATTQASSGLIATPPAPFADRYTFTFPNPGTFTYQCRIHDHMIGTLTVAAGPAQPVQGQPSFTG